VTERVVLGVVHRRAGGAEVAGQGTDVTGHHDPVAAPDAGLVAGGAFENAICPLADEHGNGGRSEAAGIELILDLDQDGNARGICILRLDQLGEREPGVLAEDIGYRGILKRVVQLKPVTAQVGLDVNTTKLGTAGKGGLWAAGRGRCHGGGVS
jgi:hypothetical protein